MEDLTKLPNIGKEMEKQLKQAGINTYDELIDIGSREAWLRIQAFDPSACYNRLCGLEGAIQRVRWHELPPQTKAALKTFYEEHKCPRK